MIIIDDLLLRAIGISIPPFDMIWLLETIRDFAEKERFNVAELSDKLKENRMLFELGEIDKKTYEETEGILIKRREEAMNVGEHISQTKEVSLL